MTEKLQSIRLDLDQVHFNINRMDPLSVLH